MHTILKSENYNMHLYFTVYKKKYIILTSGLRQGDQMMHKRHFHFCDKFILLICTHFCKISSKNIKSKNQVLAVI